MLVSDYGTGLVAPPPCPPLRHSCVNAVRLCSSTPGTSLLRFRGMTTCTPNESEVEQLFGIRIGENARVLERAGRELLKRTRAQAVLITRGSRGMALFERDRQTVHIPIHGSDQIADVTGAGDTVIATMTLALAAGASFEEASRLANYAGGLVVMKRGTATVSSDELRTADSDPCRLKSCHVTACCRRCSRIGPRAGRSRSPTAASISCTLVTFATCRRPRPKPTGSSSRSTTM